MKEVDSRPSWATRLADFVDFDTENPAVITPIEHLTELQDQLRCRLPGNVREYETTWTPNGLNLDHLEQFCRDVEQQLSAVITAQIAALEVADSSSFEIHAHRSFGELRGGFVVGREISLAQSPITCSTQRNAPSPPVHLARARRRSWLERQWRPKATPPGGDCRSLHRANAGLS